MTEILQQRQAVIAESRTWIGTPYLHGELVKGAGVDCAGFIAGVFNAAIGSHLVVRTYFEQWYLNAKVQLYLLDLAALGFVEITRDEAQPADLIISRPHNEIYSHGGILLSWPEPPSVIHCSRRGVRKPAHSMRSEWYFGSWLQEKHKFFCWGGWR